ncbi:MAG: Gfo/Idh/MocA family protein [Gammaproteobacteria bacterium]
MKSNIAVVGCGYWGKNFVRNIYELDSLYCICEQDIEIANSFTEKFNIPNYTFEQILADTNIVGIILAVPAQYHSEMAIKAMDSKKHVFVEKPLAMNVDEAKSMIESSKRNKVSLMVGHLLQYHPAFIKLKKLCLEGKIGKIKNIYSNRMSMGKVRSEEDVIWSFAPHDISMILSLINNPIETIYATGNSIIQDGISDIASIEINFADNIKAKISVSWLHPYKEHKLTVIGEKGMMVFDDTKDWNAKLTLVDYSVEEFDKDIQLTKKESNIIANESEPLKEECIHFINLINNQTINLTDGYEGLNVLKVLTEASRSLTKEDIISFKN